NGVHQCTVGAVVLVGAAGIAHDDHVVVQISAGVNRGRHADIGGAAGNDQGIDGAGAEGEVQVSLMKSAPAILGNIIVVRLRLQLGQHVGALVAGDDVHFGFGHFAVRPGCE